MRLPLLLLAAWALATVPAVSAQSSCGADMCAGAFEIYCYDERVEVPCLAVATCLGYPTSFTKLGKCPPPGMFQINCACAHVPTSG